MAAREFDPAEVVGLVEAIQECSKLSRPREGVPALRVRAEAVRFEVISLCKPVEQPQSEQPVKPMGPGEPRSRKQNRLQARLDVDTPFILLDGNPIAPFDEAATRYLARLIEADGERVSMSEFIRDNPAFDGAIPCRLRRAIPKELAYFLDGSQGKPPRLSIERLS
jgi:hypothetical protein